MATTSVQFRKHLSVTDGFVLYITAVLGQSLIVLPSIAARHAGPWSILIWAALAAISYPMARVMAELGTRYPSAGGVTAFIAKGLGPRVGQLTGVLYLAAMAVGAPVTAIICAEYLQQLTGMHTSWIVPAAGVMLATLIGINLFDVTAIMHGQRWILFICLGSVLVTIGLALPHISLTKLTDVQGYASSGIADSALIAFFAFVGWENAAFAGEEFSDPYTLVRSLRAAVIAVGALFLLLSIVVVGSLDRATIAVSNASLSDLLRFVLGNAASRVGALLAVVLIFLLMLTWTRSGGRLMVALARDGLFPQRLTRVHQASGSPRAALLMLGCIWAIALAIFALANVSVETYIQLSSANFLATYVLIFIAAWRLLYGRELRTPLIVSTISVAALVVASLPSMWYAALTTLAFALFVSVRRFLPVRS